MIENLIGKKVLNIYMNEDYLLFRTDKGLVGFEVYGDCCSHSYFHDFIGVKKLLENGPVVSAKEIDLDYDGKKQKDYEDGESVSCYGFELVTENEKFGEMTSVFSFRNASNGYYGGSLQDASFENSDEIPELKDDKILD